MQSRPESPSRANMTTPFMPMVANTPMVAPPITGCGIDVSSAANLGSKPPASKTRAAMVNTTRFTTLFSAIMPTFWPYVTVGMVPNSAATAPTAPVATIPPESSASVASRSRPAEDTAESSPMTCTTLTIETTPIMAQAAGSKTILYGKIVGSANQAAVPTPERSTIPIRAAITNPERMPKRMLPSLSVPRA